MKLDKLLILSLLFALVLVSAETTNVTDTNLTDNNITLTITSVNDSALNVSPIEVLPSLAMKSINPNSFKTGEALFNIQIYNRGNETLKNLIPLISGPGFSTSNVIPIDILTPNSIGYILVSGSFGTSGNIQLIIKLSDQTFYQNITVSSTVQESQAVSESLLANISIQLSELKQNYLQLNQLLSQKTDEGYDVASISLAETKKYIRDAEASIFIKDVSKAQINLRLAEEELLDQQSKLVSAKKISTLSKIKNNAVTFSAIAGALLTLFAVYELLKKKSEVVINKVQSVSVKMKK